MGLGLGTIITFLLYTGSSLARDDWRWVGSGCIGHDTTESHQYCEKAMVIQNTSDRIFSVEMRESSCHFTRYCWDLTCNTISSFNQPYLRKMNSNGSSLQWKARRCLKMEEKKVENHHAGGKCQTELEFVLFITSSLCFVLFCFSTGHLNAR